MARKKRHNQYNHIYRLHVRLSVQEHAKLRLILENSPETSSTLIRSWIEEKYIELQREIADWARAKRAPNNN